MNKHKVREETILILCGLYLLVGCQITEQGDTINNRNNRGSELFWYKSETDITQCTADWGSCDYTDECMYAKGYKLYTLGDLPLTPDTSPYWLTIDYVADHHGVAGLVTRPGLESQKRQAEPVRTKNENQGLDTLDRGMQELRRIGFIHNVDLQGGQVTVDFYMWLGFTSEEKKKIVGDLATYFEIKAGSPFITVLNSRSGTRLATYGLLGAKLYE